MAAPTLRNLTSRVPNIGTFSLPSKHSTPFSKNSEIFRAAKQCILNHPQTPAHWRRNIDAFLWKLAKETRDRARWLWAIYCTKVFCNRAPFAYFRKVLGDATLDGTQIIEGGALCPSRSKYVTGKIQQWLRAKFAANPMEVYEARYHWHRGTNQEEKVRRRFLKQRAKAVASQSNNLRGQLGQDIMLILAKEDHESRRRLSRLQQIGED